MNNQSLQDQFASKLICFGCGPANKKGLQLKSFVTDRVAENGAAILTARFTPAAHQLAFAGIVNGGIISTLLDCHLNWTAAWHLMQRNQSDVPPCCVTAKYEVTFLAPTPADTELVIEAWVIESSDRKAVVQGTLGPAHDVEQHGDPMISATGVGTFVAVKPGHPAYHRW